MTTESSNSSGELTYGANMGHDDTALFLGVLVVLGESLPIRFTVAD